MKSKAYSALVLCTAVAILQGCASLAEKQTGRVNSDPEGATISLYDPIIGNSKVLGVTPVEVYVQQGLGEVFLLAEKSGFETERYLLPKSGSIDHHFILTRSYALQIADEASGMKKEFKKDVARILGTFDRALNSPRMNASSVVAEARTQLQELVLNYPEHSNSATVTALKRLSEDAAYVTTLPSMYYDSQIERDGVRKVSEWITKIRAGLGLII